MYVQMWICIYENVCLCVWCVYEQGLYMDAVQLFPEQLQEFVDLMAEKELRLRLPLEELDILLEAWTGTPYLTYQVSLPLSLLNSEIADLM